MSDISGDELNRDAERPAIAPTVRNVLESDSPVDDDTLVDRVAAETSAGTLAINATVRRLEQRGEIYNAAGDENNPEWKPTRP